MILALAWIAAMVVLSVYGALIGSFRAEDLFNSLPLTIYWAAVVVLLIVGIFVWRRMLRFPGLLAIHVGCVLIVCGGMWGSMRAHSWRQARTYQFHPRRGVMFLGEGMTSRNLFRDDQTNFSLIGQLDFAVKAERLWEEYYPARQTRWPIAIVTDPQGRPDVCDFPSIPNGKAHKTLGDITVRVLEYWTDESADSPKLLIPSDTQKTRTIPARLGEKARVDALPGTIEIVKTYKNFRLAPADDGDAKFKPVDLPGGWNPALEIMLHYDVPATATTRPADADRLVRVYRPGLVIPHRIPMADRPMFMYLPAPLERHGQLAPPMVKLELTHNGRTVRGWMAASEEARSVYMPLMCLYEDDRQWWTAGQPAVILCRPAQKVRDYKADLVIMKDGREVRRKTVEVNDPLHYGGYYFFLSQMSSADGATSVMLLVRSDAGLWCVFAGSMLLLAGLVLQLWVRPVFNRQFFRRKGAAA